MIYLIGAFILDEEKEELVCEPTQKIISNNPRTIQLLSILAASYPKAVSKSELIQKLWPERDVTDWAVSTLVYQLRQLLTTYDPVKNYIKTIHAQGFKLDVEPQVLESRVAPDPNLPSIPKASASININKILYKFGKQLALGGGVLIFSSFGYYHFKTPEKSYGQIIPQKTITFPIDKGWSTSRANTIEFTKDGILVTAIDSDPLYVSTSLNEAAFYQGATFSAHVKVNQEFVDNEGGLRFFYQTTRDGWPGEWDCIVEESLIKTLDFTYRCQIDENESFTKTLAKEPVNFGVKLHQSHSVGNARITSAQLHLPASISTETGWRTTNNLKPEYNRGVSFEPKSLAAQLATTIKGPTNILESKVSFTLEVDDSYLKSNAGIQFFLISKDKQWQDCIMNGEDIKTNVFTKVCIFKNIKNPFVLQRNEKVDIGVATFGKVIQGKIKILGITLNE